MWKYLKAVFTHRPKFYSATTDQLCHRLTSRGRRIRIRGLAWGPYMLAFHVLDLTNVQVTHKIVRKDVPVIQWPDPDVLKDVPDDDWILITYDGKLVAHGQNLNEVLATYGQSKDVIVTKKLTRTLIL